jgi:hypothetical protein
MWKAPDVEIFGNWGGLWLFRLAIAFGSAPWAIASADGDDLGVDMITPAFRPWANSFSDILAFAPVPTLVFTGFVVNGKVIAITYGAEIPTFFTCWLERFSEITNIKSF